MTNNMTHEVKETDSKSSLAGAGENPKRSSVTLKDVAKRANVSPTTASLFFNGREDVCAKSTAIRLRQAAAELQYPINRGRRRSGAGRSAGVSAAGPFHSRTGRTLAVETPDRAISQQLSSETAAYILGVCIPHGAIPSSLTPNAAGLMTPDTSLEQVWRGISHVADVENCQILQYPRRTREGLSITPFLEESRVDGIIMLATPDDPRPGLLADSGMPVVLIGRLAEIPDGCGAVFTLESDTVDLALSHLWQLGHRRIAYAAGSMAPEIPIQDEIAKRRLDRYSAWTQIRGVFDPELVFSVTDWEASANGAVEAMVQMRAMPNCPTAVFCETDAIALAACRAAAAAGVRVPEEISILGVGNSVSAADNMPSISSVEIPYEEIGIQAVVQLTRLLEGASPAACRSAIAVTNLVVRESTGPALPGAAQG